MNRADLIDFVSDITSLTKIETGKAVDAVFDAITAALGRGEEFTMVGFGSFSVTDRPAREGRNPRTGEALQIAACKVPTFKPGKKLKEAVNASKIDTKL